MGTGRCITGRPWVSATVVLLSLAAVLLAGCSSAEVTTTASDMSMHSTTNGRVTATSLTEGTSAISVESQSGLFIARVDSKWGYIDRTGKILIEPQFDEVSRFSDGLAPIYEDGKGRGYIDTTGRVVVEPQFEEARGFSDGLAAFKPWNRREYGFIDTSGKVVIPPQFERVTEFSEGLCAAEDGGRWGYIDKTGQWVIEPRLDSNEKFSDGMAAVPGGYIGRTGAWVIKFEPTFGNGGEFSDGLAAVEVDTGDGAKSGYIDKTGQWVIEPQFAEAAPFSERLAAAAVWVHLPTVPRTILWGYIDKSGEWVIEPRFALLMGRFSGGLAAVAVHTSDGMKFGYIDETGNYVVEPRFDMAYEFSDGLGRIWSHDANAGGYVDTAGRLIWMDKGPNPVTTSITTQ